MEHGSSLLLSQEPATDPSLTQMNPFHPFPSHLTRCLLILYSHLSFRFSNQNFELICHPSHVWHMSTHVILLDFVTVITVGVAYKLRSSTLCSLLHPPTTSTLLRPNILLTILFSNTRNLCSFSVGDQVSHPYNTSRIGAVHFNL